MKNRKGQSGAILVAVLVICALIGIIAAGFGILYESQSKKESRRISGKVAKDENSGVVELFNTLVNTGMIYGVPSGAYSVLNTATYFTSTRECVPLPGQVCPGAGGGPPVFPVGRFWWRFCSGYARSAILTSAERALTNACGFQLPAPGTFGDCPVPAPGNTCPCPGPGCGPYAEFDVSVCSAHDEGGGLFNTPPGRLTVTRPACPRYHAVRMFISAQVTGPNPYVEIQSVATITTALFVFPLNLAGLGPDVSFFWPPDPE